MGVYIRGMEMPTSCRQCSLYLQSMDSERNVYENCAVTAKSYNWGLTTRPSDCPLVPVQPHGRLIDADALAEVFRGFIAMYDSCPFSQLSFPDKARRDEIQSALAEVINAPTIITASEEGE